MNDENLPVHSAIMCSSRLVKFDSNPLSGTKCSVANKSNSSFPLPHNDDSLPTVEHGVIHFKSCAIVEKESNNKFQNCFLPVSLDSNTAVLVNMVA